MKNRKFSKICLWTVALALLLTAFAGISAQAEEAPAAPEIVSKNIKVDGNYSLMFAVDPATGAGDEVTLNV